MPSLRKGLAAIGASPKGENAVAVSASFEGRTPRSLRATIDGMSDPQVGNWNEVGISFKSENTDDSHEAQGIATDGKHWFLISNGSKRIVMFDNHANRLLTVGPTNTVWDVMWNDQGRPDQSDDDLWNPHFGAGCFYDGAVYVPIQNPMGIWRVDFESGEQRWRKASYTPRNDMFPWCAIHPVTGVLYTSNYGEHPFELNAYDRDTVVYREGDNITLGPRPLDIDRIQGAAFTKHGRVILVRYDFGAVFCFSSLNGHCFGAKEIDDYDEPEAVVLRTWHLEGATTHVHILELANDIEDDCYLHSYAIPDPARL